MREQHREVIRKEQSHQQATASQQPKTVETAVIAISMGEGISELFTSMGATHIISGGQTMNPSTEDIVKVIEQSECQRAIILQITKILECLVIKQHNLLKADTVVIQLHLFLKVLQHFSNMMLHLR